MHFKPISLIVQYLNVSVLVNKGRSKFVCIACVGVYLRDFVWSVCGGLFVFTHTHTHRERERESLLSCSSSFSITSNHFWGTTKAKNKLYIGGIMKTLLFLSSRACILKGSSTGTATVLLTHYCPKLLEMWNASDAIACKCALTKSMK